ncbi:lebercilin-like isoform X2 [Ptychodera flava]|uniref:lebercilin-like isoform X2 n=1 Tax=Ptychodera flava TaxID=63121 RepID=UPI00396A2363
MTSNDYDDTDSFFDTEPKPLKGEYNRGNTTPERRNYSPSININNSGQRSPTASYTISPEPKSSARRSDKMAQKSKTGRRQSYDNQSRQYSGYSDTKSYAKSNHYDSYSDDDFESDHDSEYDKRSPRKGKFGSSRTNTLRRTYSGSTTYSTSSAYGNYRPKASHSDKPYVREYRPYHRNKGTGRKTRKGRSQSQGSKISPREPDMVAKRMLSARLHSISRLKNELGELRHEYDDVVRENKLLRALQRKQERAIDKFEGQQNELGELLSRHNNEVEHLQKRVQRLKGDNLDKERRLRDKDDELMKTQNTLKRMKAIVKEKNLMERDELDRKLHDTQEELDRKDKRVQDLERYIENLKKNHKVESTELRIKQREYDSQLQHLQHEYDKLRITLKEKEKELEVRNIYSNRVFRAPTKLSHSVSATPQPTPRKVKTANKAVQVVDLSEDDKPAPVVTAIEEKTIEEVEEEEEEEEEPPREEIPPPRMNSFDKEKERQRQLEEDKKRMAAYDEEQRQREEAARILRELDMSSNQQESDEQRKREEEERLEMQKERQKSSKYPRGSFMYTLEKKKQERERREREQRDRELQERREREERERREREERERKEREEAGFKPSFLNSFSSSSTASQSKAESHSTSRRHEPQPESSYRPTFTTSSSKPSHAKDSSAVTFKKPTPAFFKDGPTSTQSDKDPGFVVGSARGGGKTEHERRERERQELEEKEQAEKAKVDEERRKKDLLLAKMREIDAGKDRSPSGSAKTHKQYMFSDPIENLHNGVPSHPTDGSHSGKKKKPVEENDDLEFGSYAPSFGRRAEKTKPKPKGDWLQFMDDSGTPERKNSPPEKKSELMSNLFGTETTEKAKPTLGDNIFTAATKAKPVADKDAYPWEKDVNVVKAGRRTSNFDDNNDDKLLPRRPRDSNALFTTSKPTVNAIDDIEDDIEEVIL